MRGPASHEQPVVHPNLRYIIPPPQLEFFSFSSLVVTEGLLSQVRNTNLVLDVRDQIARKGIQDEEGSLEPLASVIENIPDYFQEYAFKETACCSRWQQFECGESDSDLRRAKSPSTGGVARRQERALSVGVQVANATAT